MANANLPFSGKTRPKPPVPQRMGTYFSRYWQLWVMLMPAVVYIFIFNYIPMYGLQLAVRDYSFAAGFTGGEFAGPKYFLQYFRSSMFWPTLRNTFLISFVSILTGFPAPIILAMIINQIRNQRWKRAVQTTVYVPYFISVVVMVSMINIMLAQQAGIISNFMKDLNLISEDTNLLGNASIFVWVYALTGVWQGMGWNSIIYLAALSSVDTQLYDAARIDGASRFKTMIHIDFPAVVPTIIILLILNMGNILFVGFDKVFLMQNTLNLGRSQVISTYVYTVGIQSSQFSFGTAVGLFNTVINFLFLISANSISKRLSGSGLM